MQIEQHILFLINQQWTSSLTDWVMAIVTNWNFWKLVILIIAVLFGIFGGFRARAALLCAVVCVGIVDAVIVASIKHAVRRPRPYMVLQGIRQVELARVKPAILALAKPLKIQYSHPLVPAMYGPSFPSAHAANNFAVATVFFLFFRRWGWLLLISALLVSYSRVYVGSHWPLDVIAAAFIGTGVAFILTLWIELSWRRWGTRFFPRLAVAYPSLLKVSIAKRLL